MEHRFIKILFFIFGVVSEGFLATKARRFEEEYIENQNLCLRDLVAKFKNLCFETSSFPFN
jgi:hypothetical protein